MTVLTRRRLRHRIRAEEVMRSAVGDFSAVGLPAGPLVTRIERGEEGTLVAHLDVADRTLRVCAEQHQRLAVAVASFLQEGEFLRGNRWPTIPGLGLLRPMVQSDRAVWALPDGEMLCDIGELFEPAP